MRSFARGALSIVLSSLLVSCYTYRAVKPTELPKLSGVTQGQVVDGAGAGSTVAVASRVVETPDGRMIEVRGDFDLVVTARSRTVTLEHPIRATLDDTGLLTIKSNNRPPWVGNVSDVDSAQVKQADRNTTVMWAAILVPAGALLLGYLGYLVFRSEPEQDY